ncbi:hypothetical protein J4G37_36105, partial [Microvirga sp. 3-52]|nr:hypothetical protein [Microvirga sp. 3-52]
IGFLFELSEKKNYTLFRNKNSSYFFAVGGTFLIRVGRFSSWWLEVVILWSIRWKPKVSLCPK